MNLQEILYNELNSNMILEKELRELVEKNVTEVVKADSESLISKEEVIEYLKNNGRQLTQKNFEMARLFLLNKLKENAEIAENGEIKMTYTKQEYINHLSDFSVEEMNSLINVCILRKIQRIEEQLKDSYYEYDIKKVSSFDALVNLINQYAENGYRVKNVFASEWDNIVFKQLGTPEGLLNEELIVIFERLKR